MGASGATRTHVELVADLVARVTARLLDPLVILLESEQAVAELRERIRINAEMWAAQLLGPDEQRAATTAARLLAALYPGDEPFDPPPEWWAAPFGRVVLHRIGHPSRERVSYAGAGAMLGITRQGVHDLLARGKLQPHPDSGVTTASVRDRSLRRAGFSTGRTRPEGGPSSEHTTPEGKPSPEHTGPEGMPSPAHATPEGMPSPERTTGGSWECPT